MRIAILAPLLVVPSVLAHIQQPLPATRSTTLVDVLSADPNYTSLLRLLQRARLIPTLNRLTSGVLFAPTNDAIKDHPLWLDFLRGNPSLLTDNVQEQLRQQLFYHLLNDTDPTLPTDEKPVVFKTLHYPRAPKAPPSRTPPTSPPWVPVPGGTLGGEPQKLRASSRDHKSWVGVDAFGKHGTLIVNRTEATNGIVFGVSKFLDPPPDLGTSSLDAVPAMCVQSLKALQLASSPFNPLSPISTRSSILKSPTS